MQPSISVIIPVHNRTQELNRCLTGLASQSGVSISEIIIVDDGSTEKGPRELALSFQAKYIRLEESMGSGYSKNIGLLKSNGDFVLFLDSDVEFISSYTLLVMVRALSANDNYGEVGGEALVDQKGNVGFVFGRNIDFDLGRSKCDYFPVGITSETDNVIEYDYIPTSNCLLRRKLALEIGGFDDSYSCLGEDKDFGYRVKKQGFKNCVLEQGVILHRFSPTGRTKNALNKQYRTQIRFYLKHFGFGATNQMVLKQTRILVSRAISPLPIQFNSAVEPTIQEFESHYREKILGFNKIDNNIDNMREAIISLSAFWAAYIWNIVNRRGIRCKGSVYFTDLL